MRHIFWASAGRCPSSQLTAVVPRTHASRERGGSHTGAAIRSRQHLRLGPLAVTRVQSRSARLRHREQIACTGHLSAADGAGVRLSNTEAKDRRTERIAAKRAAVSFTAKSTCRRREGRSPRETRYLRQEKFSWTAASRRVLRCQASSHRMLRRQRSRAVGSRPD
jgi:hypothetical protein